MFSSLALDLIKELLLPAKPGAQKWKSWKSLMREREVLKNYYMRTIRTCRFSYSPIRIYGINFKSSFPIVQSEWFIIHKEKNKATMSLPFYLCDTMPSSSLMKQKPYILFT